MIGPLSSRKNYPTITAFFKTTKINKENKQPQQIPTKKKSHNVFNGMTLSFQEENFEKERNIKEISIIFEYLRTTFPG